MSQPENIPVKLAVLVFKKHMYLNKKQIKLHFKLPRIGMTAETFVSEQLYKTLHSRIQGSEHFQRVQ